jgi:seryl-tRNA synthetase
MTIHVEEKANEILEMAKELRQLLGSTEALKIEENVYLQYVITVKDDNIKENLMKLSEDLTRQAAQHKVDLEIIVATQEEINEARKRLLAFQS